MQSRAFILIFLLEMSDAILRDPGNLFLNTFFHAPQVEFLPTYDLLPPAAPYFTSYVTSSEQLLPVREPKLLTPDIEQYEGERYFKEQRGWNHHLNVDAVVGYSEQLSGKALAYTAAANQMSRTPQERHYGIFPRQTARAPPRYRYTQVGLSYGSREDFHHKDGGYGPFDPHGLLEYKALEMRNHRAVLRRSRIPT